MLAIRAFTVAKCDIVVLLSFVRNFKGNHSKQQQGSDSVLVVLNSSWYACVHGLVHAWRCRTTMFRRLTCPKGELGVETIP